MILMTGPFAFQDLDYLGRAMRKRVRAYADSESPDQTGNQTANAQSNQGLHYPLTESLDTTECMNGEQKPG